MVLSSWGRYGVCLEDVDPQMPYLMFGATQCRFEILGSPRLVTDLRQSSRGPNSVPACVQPAQGSRRLIETRISAVTTLYYAGSTQDTCKGSLAPMQLSRRLSQIFGRPQILAPWTFNSADAIHGFENTRPRFLFSQLDGGCRVYRCENNCTIQLQEAGMCTSHRCPCHSSTLACIGFT